MQISGGYFLRVTLKCEFRKKKYNPKLKYPGNTSIAKYTSVFTNNNRNACRDLWIILCH